MFVDIIIATYNRPKILPNALKSIQAQTYSNWRCWIAEDGKSQETLEAVSPFLQDERFIYFPGSHAGRPAVPRNRAISQGCGELITFLDDDDTWLPEKLERQVDFMRCHPNCVLLGCNAFRTGQDEAPGSETPLYFKKKSFFGLISYERFVQQNHIILSSSMIRRSVLEKSGVFNETLSPAEDYELWLRIGALGEIWNIPKPLVVSRDSALARHYPKLNRQENYRQRARVLEYALAGNGNIISPLSCAENEHCAAACRYERRFYLAGPRFLGRFRHELLWKIKALWSRPL
ncbi:MAG TPA: glycosyltransferase [Deltaproteobacteria bacterium]|mgnify:CR=1 FL=1|nr:glycosyltransferase [Deltaproteobacteria bacterium]